MIDVRSWFLLSILSNFVYKLSSMNLQIETKFCINIIIDKIYVGIVNKCFSQISVFRKFSTEIRPLIVVRIWFLLNILRTNRQNKTKFCIHIIIDKIYVGSLNSCFSQICNRVTVLDSCQNSGFTQYLE